MPARNIVYYPDPILGERSAPVSDFSKDLSLLVDDLVDTMRLYGGLGISAPQIGVLKRVFIVSKEVLDDIAFERYKTYIAFINPEIISMSEETNEELEGCLSFPKIYLPVKRANSVRIRFQDVLGDTTEITASGYGARAVLHEQDHLNGELFLRFFGPVRKSMVEKKMWKFRKNLEA